MKDIKERFLAYVAVETTSGAPKEGRASTDGQYVLANRLKEELEELKAQEITVNEFGTVTALIPGSKPGPTIALIAHIDTSEAASGRDVKARSLRYEGGAIELKPGTVLDPDEFLSLHDKKGHELIVTDGTTLLGGDDKAGIAIIMDVLQTLKNEGLEHLPLEVIFTTDEEIGCGAAHVLDEDIKADFGYTVDGGALRYVNVENFNAGSLEVTVNGVSIHPGDAKDKMKNAVNIAIEFHEALPRFDRPEHSAGRQGFFHLRKIEGTEEKAHLTYIVRDFDPVGLHARFELARLTAERLNRLYGDGTVKLEADENEYRNMKVELDRHPEAVARIENAYKKLGVSYEFQPIRGGTDGAGLTFRGLPCPNLATGDYNCHGRFEYVDVDEMKTMVRIVLEIVR